MTVTAGDPQVRLAEWLRAQHPGATELRVEGMDQVAMGHSAETIVLTLVVDGARHEVCVRIRPPWPGLLEPYDFARQFAILRALEPTPVRAPKALWLETTCTVVGRELYVMERLPGTVYERRVPDELHNDPPLIRAMCESMVDQIAAIHNVDLAETGLDAVAAGTGYLEQELDHWGAELERVCRAPLPALELVLAELRRQRPEQSERITLVHGDPKPGNFAFVGGEVTGVFDWELATIGDPLSDLGWTETLWVTPNSITGLPGALSRDEFIARWEELTGLTAHRRPWYRAFQSFKMAIILLVGGWLFDTGRSNDRRMYEMTHAIHPLALGSLKELGVDLVPESGPVQPARQPPHRAKRGGS